MDSVSIDGDSGAHVHEVVGLFDICSHMLSLRILAVSWISFSS